VSYRLLVCGGRDYADWVKANRILDPYLAQHGVKKLIVIEGGANGADRIARQWATRNGVHTATVNALWDRNGKSAGPIRNRAMLLLQPSEVLAFPGGTGTAHMIAQARAAGVPVTEVE
jgi:hypothetical protein